MYKTILVKELVKDGAALLNKLSAQGFPIFAAFWLYLPEPMHWRLVIATPVVDDKGPILTYTLIQQTLASLGQSDLGLSDISVVSPQGTDFQELRALIERMGQMAGPAGEGRIQDVIFEDAYIYKW